MKKICILSASLVMLFIFGTTASHATITVLAYYQLGDIDSPAYVYGGAGDNPSKDTQGGTGLTPVGTTPTYSADYVAKSSNVSMNFSGGYYRLGNPVTTATADIGFEAWVKASATGSTVFMNGDGFSSNGQYLYSDATDGKWHWAKAGTADGGFAPVTLNQWIHLAMVLDDTGVLHAYTNGVPVGTLGGGVNPALAGTDFTIGKAYNGIAGQFHGLIDEVRVFSFANFASFNPLTDLNLTVPEPSTVMLLGLGGLLVWRRRPRKCRM